MKVIGVAGYARSGKDTFSSIAIDILKRNGITAKQYSFAGALKEEVRDFLLENCGVDVFTNDNELKKDIRDFLVWYGTTFWRKRDPKRWIRGVDELIKADGDKIDIAIVSDVRYPNEAEWVHSWGGYLIHLQAWRWEERRDGQGGEVICKCFFDAPNEQELINDPIVKKQSDYCLEWPMKNLTSDEVFNNSELRANVLRSLNSCSWFISALNQ